LNEYIGNGEPWDLDRASSGVRVLPPYQGKDGADWYKGTANAIYQNLNFINRYDPDYVLILSGDHIYKMDYSLMLRQHKETGADCTIAVLDVPLEQASRFGIMTTDENYRITEFEEKPPQPKSTKASMGIYIFSRKVLESYLIRDEKDPNSSKDFGKNIIPKMLEEGCSMYAYPFSGYWKDVGTIGSLWEANMDLLGADPEFKLYDPEWRIYFRNNAEPPHLIGDYARVTNSMLTEGCEIYGIVENSVLSHGVKVARGAYVKDSVIMANVTIGEGATVNYSIIDSDAEIGAGAVIGRTRSTPDKIALIGSGVTVAPGTDIPAGAMINANDLDRKL
jgi:glucose-1-phosphate adenylyltransferase